MSARAAIVDIHVTSAADSGPNTLRQAIIDGNALPASNDAPRILVDLDGNNPILLQSPLPTLTAPVFYIIGNLQGRARINGQDTHTILDVHPDVLLLRLEHLGLYHGLSGNASAACLNMPGDSRAGSATLMDVWIQSCKKTTTGVARGGAVVMGRNLTVTDSVFQFNQALGSSDVAGGALALTGNNSMTASNSYFGSNMARASGGTSVGLARGGAIFISLGNTLSISDSTLVENVAIAPNNPDSGRELGGALYAALKDEAEIERSSFAFNQTGTGGAIYHFATTTDATLFMRNTTAYKNSAFEGMGGAVFSNGDLSLRSNTFWKNNAVVAGDNIATDTAGLDIDSAFNNLFAAGDGVGDSCHGFGSSLASGWNIVPAAECGLGNGNGSQINTNLHIRGVYSGVGPTHTVELYAGSPALDAGNPAAPDDSDFDTCPETDMLGQPRPVDSSGTGAPARCDIGAREAQSEPSIFIDNFDGDWLRP